MKTALILIAGMTGLAAALLWRHPSAPVELAEGAYLTPSRALPEFSLLDHHGRPFTPRAFLGHWSILFFGYTNCPDFCPTTLTTLAAMERRLRDEHAPQRPQVVFVSVDAGRDTPAQLEKYVPYFDPEFIGVTAPDQPTIEALARELGVAVSLRPQPGGGYAVDHSGALFVIDPTARVAAILTGPYTAQALAADFARLLAAARP